MGRNWFSGSNARSDELNEAHNRGQSDAAEGIDNPPGSLIDDLLKDDMHDFREAYRDGHANHDK